MNVTEFAIRRWQLTLVMFSLLIALGYSAFSSIPRAVDPHFPLPVVVITAIQPGADAEEMEQTVAKPIEELMQGLEDVKEIVSTSNDSSTVIRAEFDWSGDPDRYFNDTVREVTAIFAFGHVGIDPSSALAISILVGLCSTAVVLAAWPY